MRHVIKLPTNKEQEDLNLNENSKKYKETDSVIIYQILSIVVQKILSKIIQKTKSDISLSGNEQLTVYELSYTFYLLVSQTNNFRFSS